MGVELALTDGRPTKLTEGRLGEIGLTEGVLSELKETEGRLIGPKVGTGIPKYSTLTETSWGGPVGPLLPAVKDLNTERTDVVRLDECTAGTVMAVELLTVTEGITIGLAETREASRKGRMEGRCMAFAAEGVFLSSLFFPREGRGCLDRRGCRRRRKKGKAQG